MSKNIKKPKIVKTLPVFKRIFLTQAAHRMFFSLSIALAELMDDIMMKYTLSSMQVALDVIIRRRRK